MLAIYAQTFMTATRSPHVRLRDLPPAPAKKLRWFSRKDTTGGAA
jgi:hypothetical protein